MKTVTKFIIIGALIGFMPFENSIAQGGSDLKADTKTLLSEQESASKHKLCNKGVLLHGCIIEPLDMRIPTKAHDLSSWIDQSLYGSAASTEDCRCLAMDGDFLWVGTSAGAVRLNLKDGTSSLFKREGEELLRSIDEMRDSDRRGELSEEEKNTQLHNWAKNVVENIVVLSPGHIWVDMLSGVLLASDDNEQVFANTEEALAELYHTDLRPTLHKVTAVDQNGYLWVRWQFGTTVADEVFVRCYDGNAWKTVDCHEAEGLVADKDGTIWVCGHDGVFKRENAQWKQAVKGFFTDIVRSSSGRVFAFGIGKFAALADNQWDVFQGKGRYEDFQLYAVSRGKQRDVWETSDGKMWFADLDMGLLSFDGNTVKTVPKISEVYAIVAGTNQSLMVFAVKEFWKYSNGKWEMEPIPPRTTVVNDIQAIQDDTLFAAFGDGLLRYRGGKWGKMQLGERLVTDIPVGLQQQEFALTTDTGKISAEMQQKMYEVYVETDGKKLIDATNDQLVRDILLGDYPSSMISYHRLSLRANKQAKKYLAQRVNSIIKTGLGKEDWITAMELAAYGSAATEPLLNVVQKGSSEERQIALGALMWLSDPNVAEELLKILNRNKKKNPDTYLGTALVAAMTGNPVGIDMFIEAATFETEKELSIIQTDQMDAEDFKKSSRGLLEKITNDYDDLPNDWLKYNSHSWWQKHRNTWKPSSSFVEPARTQASMEAMYRIYVEIAKRLEVSRRLK
jgi:hypothetical protein